MNHVIKRKNIHECKIQQNGYHSCLFVRVKIFRNMGSENEVKKKGQLHSRDKQRNTQILFMAQNEMENGFEFNRTEHTNFVELF